jgi:hypothetical protein
MPMPYCENCGKPTNPNANFCQNCGSPQNRQQQISPTLMVNIQAQTLKPQGPLPEKILGFIIVNRQKSFRNPEYLTCVLTNERLIFVPMTKDVLSEVTKINRAQAKNNSTEPAVYPYQQNYLNMAPSTIVSQTPTCSAIKNSAIRQIDVTLVDIISDGYSDFQEYKVQVIAEMGIHELRMTKRSEYIERLRQVYSDKMKVA